ncbi:flagellar hook-basal body protein [Mariniblastus fucicola]|uniref:Flagellar basal-body rod protein FlgF n=1 Tax=Mariniblastus fucicola TaxID=980251 RepID=A0A5B9P9G6_9BACT|nr:flagellar hook-basal body protein [Mariniblastus fucicola]QEG23387.1 Flagellar basal-body rod protein FlgF [Mariniblastus fucicola]
MIRGLYNGAAALDVITRQQEVISSNLANLNTSGYRSAQLVVNQRENPQPNNPRNELGPESLEVLTSFENGRLHQTDRPLDASLVGDGFFSFESPDGTLYSRAGHFYRSPDSGTLVSNEGLPVLGESGPINIPADIADSEIVIGEDGTVSGKGQQFGKLAVVGFRDNQSLERVSQSFFKAGQNSVQTDATAVVTQFNQEYSNGNAVSEMIAMVIGTRHYEAVQKATTAISEAMREHIRA